MQTLQLNAFGIENLQFAERPVPEPGEKQVLVRMHAFSLNYRDLLVVRGQYDPNLKVPLVPFSDGAGEIIAVGPGVTHARPGDRVMGAFFQKWITGESDETGFRSALGGAIDGVAAEYNVFDEDGLIHLPEYLTWEEAASLPCAAVTAWHALVSAGHLRPEETVLLLGTGGVSIFALQFAKLMKARVIATSSRPEKFEKLLAMGAESTINYREREDWHKAVRELTGGRGVDQVVEVGGAGTIAKSIRAVRAGGLVHLIGVLSGRPEADLSGVLMRNIRLQGIYVGSREMAEDMLRAMAAHAIHPVIDRVFPFSEVHAALTYMESGDHFGKIVVTMN